MRYFYVSYTCIAALTITSNPERVYGSQSFESETFLNEKEFFDDVIELNQKSIVYRDTIRIISIFEFKNEEDFKNFRE